VGKRHLTQPRSQTYHIYHSPQILRTVDSIIAINLTVTIISGGCAILSGNNRLTAQKLELDTPVRETATMDCDLNQ